MSRVIPAFTQFFDGTGAPLANGYLNFLVSQTVDTNKNTYADVDQTIPNANPLQLDGEGRCPNVFGQGIYKVVLYAINPVTGLPGSMIQSFDPVVADYQSEGAGGNFAEWDASTIYQIGQIVIYNGLYYRSHIANNVGNQPDISAASWERIDFLRFWNLDVTYGLDDVAIYNSNLYFSLQAGNLNHTPNTSPTWWDPVGSGTILLNWLESGTDFIPATDGYNIGDATHRPGTVYIADAPTADDQGANKAYVDGRGTGLTNWEDAGDLRPLTDDNDDLGDATHRAANIWIANDPTDPDHAAKKSYVDAFDHITDWEDTGTTLRPKADDSEDLGDSTHRPSNIWIANDATNDDHAVRKSQLDSTLAAVPVSGFNNRAINGRFLVWQRATSQTSSGLGSDDMWYNTHVGSTKTHSRQAFAIDQTDVPNNPKYFSRTVISAAGAGVGDLTLKEQHIEDAQAYAGENAILEFWAKADSSKNIATEFYRFHGTGGSASTPAIEVTTHSLTTAWQFFQIEVSIPDLSGETIGSAGDDFLSLNFWFDAGSSYDSRTNSLGHQTGTFDIAEIQLRPVNTNWEYRPIGAEEELCYRYYQKSYNRNDAPGSITTSGIAVSYISGMTLGAHFSFVHVGFKVKMRTIPTVVTYSDSTGTPGYVRCASGDISATFSGIGETGFNVYGNDPVASTNPITIFHWTASAPL